MLNRAQTGLLVVDIQGKLARQVEQSERLIARSALLIEGPTYWICRSSGWSRPRRNSARRSRSCAP